MDLNKREQKILDDVTRLVAAGMDKGLRKRLIAFAFVIAMYLALAIKALFDGDVDHAWPCVLAVAILLLLGVEISDNHQRLASAYSLIRKLSESSVQESPSTESSDKLVGESEMTESDG